MSIDEITAEAQVVASPDMPGDMAELAQEQHDAIDAAFMRRIEGGSRSAAVNSLTCADVPVERANSVIDSIDEVIFMMHAICPNDVSAEAEAKIAQMQAEDPGEVRVPMTKEPEALLMDAKRMAVRGQTLTAIVAFLKDNGAGEADAKRVAAKVTSDVRAARLRFDHPRQGVLRSVARRIGAGVRRVTSGSGVQSSGRRSASGATIGGLVALGPAPSTS